MPWTPIAPFVLDSRFGFQTANAIREQLIALASARLTYALGGSRQVALPQVAADQDAIDYLDIELDGTALGGFTKQLRVEVRTDDAGTAITPKLWNVTDGTDAAVGVSSTGTAADYSGTNQKQTIAVTLAAGVKKYRLMGTPAATTDPTWVIGHLEIFATA